jgi:hypothetical protein
VSRVSLGLVTAPQTRVARQDLAAVALVLTLAIVAGLVAAEWPMVALAFACIGTCACLLTLGHRLTALFLVLMPCLLLGYALFDRTFAYVGVYPIFISEVVLLIATLHLVVARRELRLTWVHWLLIAFMTLGLFRTLPYLESDGINALRDGTLWAYGLFAFAIAAGTRAEHFQRITSWYGRAIPVFLLWTPIAGLLARFYGDQVPTIFGTTVSILSLKSGDIGVHLAGIATFFIVGLSWDRLRGQVAEVLMWVLWITGVGIVGSANRGSMLAAGTAFISVLFFRPTLRRVWRLVLAVAIAAVLVGSAPQLESGFQRTLSVEQVALNIQSIFVDTGAGQLEGTKVWRTQWWNAIIDYTVNGPFFWTGKGFGVNLADDDGFQVDTEGGTLRSPHNSHLTVLARMGVPGLALWVLLQAGFAVSLLWSYFRARRHEATFWCRIDIWLLVYWLAFIVNASFDVFFEGPQGGIWFWSVFGLGLAAIGIQRTLFDEADRARVTSLVTVASPRSVQPA